MKRRGILSIAVAAVLVIASAALPVMADGYDDFLTNDGVKTGTVGYAEPSQREKVVMVTEENGRVVEGVQRWIRAVSDTTKDPNPDAGISAPSSQVGGKMVIKMTVKPGTSQTNPYSTDARLAILLNASQAIASGTPVLKFGLAEDNYKDSYLKMSLYFEDESTVNGIKNGYYSVGLGYRTNVNTTQYLSNVTTKTALVNLNSYLEDNFTSQTWYNISIPLDDLTLSSDWDWDREGVVEFRINKSIYGTGYENTTMYVTNLWIDKPVKMDCDIAYGIFNAEGSCVSEMSELTAGEKITFKAYANNAKTIDEDVLMFLAVYEDGKLKEIVPNTAVAVSGTDTDLGGCSYTLPDNIENITVKGFVWSKFENIQAYVDSIEIEQ